MTINEKAIAELEYLKAKPLLSKREYSILTGLSLPTITRLVLSGEIPAKRIGDGFR